MSTEVDGRKQRGAASRVAILDAAELLFSEGGYHSTSLRAIAAATGMSHAGVLKHFRTKGELLVATLQRLEEGNDIFALTLPETIPVGERVRMLLEHTASQVAAVHLRVILLGEATDDDHPAHPYVLGQLARVEGDLAFAFRTDPVDLLALWNGLQLVWQYLPDIDPVALADSYFASLAPTAVEHPPARVSVALKREPAQAPEGRAEHIVAAATEAFARHGFRSTGLREIAADLGLSHGTLLYHFPTKVDLLTAVLDERDRAESLPWSWDATPLDHLNGMYLQALHNEQRPHLGRLFSTLVCEAIDESHPAHEYFRSRYAGLRSKLVGALAELVAQGVAKEGIDPDAEAVALIALWEGLGLRGLYLDDERGLPERLRARLNSLLNVTLNHASVTTG